MSEAQAAEILAAHNAWRRHNSADELPCLPMQDPLDVGRAIDVAVKALAECEQLRADAARLDWIEKGGQWTFTRLRASTAPDAPRYWCIEDWDGDDLTEDVDEDDRQTLRAAIDAAMKETE